MADKKEFHYFVLPEYEEEEQYLRDMAKKGYLLEKVTLPGVYHFKKNEPVDMIYRIDFNPQKKEDRDSYLQMYADFGWTYIQDLNEFSYFCKAEDGSDDEIFNDNASRVEMMERIINRKLLPILAIFLCCLIPLGMRILMGNDFHVPGSIALFILWAILVVLDVSVIARCAAGFRKLRKKYNVQ